jgi:hypothetical protein
MSILALNNRLNRFALLMAFGLVIALTFLVAHFVGRTTKSGAVTIDSNQPKQQLSNYHSAKTVEQQRQLSMLHKITDEVAANLPSHSFL